METQDDDELVEGPDGVAGSRSALHRLLAHVPVLLKIYQAALLAVGVGVVGFGVLLLPLPGPGWLVIYAGVWVLSLEFPAAARALAVLRRWLRALVRFLRARRARRLREESQRGED